VQIIDREPDKAAQLAAGLQENPAAADVQAAAQYAAALSGQRLVDISNPVDFSTFDSLVVAPGTSAAEQIAAAAPTARVVKA
jgi:predicted dinucleotide-binding enzyme